MAINNLVVGPRLRSLKEFKQAWLLLSGTNLSSWLICFNFHVLVQNKILPFGELVLLYSTDHNYDSALRLFRREMHEMLGMWGLQIVGYKENAKRLTRS